MLKFKTSVLEITKKRPQDWMEVALQGDMTLSEALCSVAASSYGMTHAEGS